MPGALGAESAHVSGVPLQFGLLDVRLLAVTAAAPVYAAPLTEASVMTIDCVADET
jgi:hypothetical protein